MDKAPGFLIRVERMVPDRIWAIEQALLGAYPTLKSRRDTPPGELYLWGRYKLELPDQTLADEIAALVWATNGRYCALEVYRWEKGQWPGQGGRLLKPAKTSKPGNALGLTDEALDLMMAHWNEDDGERHLVRDINARLLTPNQKRILDEHGLSARDLLHGNYPLVLGDAVNRMLRDWNDRLGQDYFHTTDLGEMIASIEDNLDADLHLDADGFGLTPRS